MYCYLKCITEGLNYQYVPEAEVWYQLPQNFNDHLKQSSRFLSAKKEQVGFFNPEQVKEEFQIPSKVFIKTIGKSFFIIVAYPFHILAYIGIELLIFLKSFKITQKQTWDIAVSSKSQ